MPYATSIQFLLLHAEPVQCAHVSTSILAVFRCKKFIKSEAEKHCSTFYLYMVNIVLHGLTRLKKFISQRTSKLCNKLFCLPTFSVLCMHYLLYLMFRCDFDVTESLEELNTAITTTQWMKLVSALL